MKPLLSPGRRHAFAWLLAAALFFAQGLGLAHRVLHTPGQPGQPGSEALFGQHDGNDCRLFNHLALGDALSAALALLPPALSFALPAATGHSGVEVAFSAAYQARAPPRG